MRMPAYGALDTLPAVPPATVGHRVADLAQPADTGQLWLGAWLAGGLAVAALLALQQQRYRCQLQPGPDGQWRAPAGASPAMVGLWPQRLVLPEDFEQRFDADTRRLVLAHQAVHAQRWDNAWNLLGAGPLCLQWFNPLAWWAWGRLRDDQELACDAAVLDGAPEPAARATYARAMLAAQRNAPQPALVSGWATRHPLVRRMQQLVRHRAAPRWQRKAGLLLVAGLGTGAALLARAAQEPAAAPAAPAALAASSPAGQGLAFDVSSQVGSANWHHGNVRLPLDRPLIGGPSGITFQAMQPGWCLYLTLYVFADGSIRPTGQVMDETCKQPLSNWQELQTNGRVALFIADTAQGPLQAQVSARWMQPSDPALPALARAEASAWPMLSPAQQRVVESQRNEMTRMTQTLEAQDRAWRAARDGQPGSR